MSCSFLLRVRAEAAASCSQRTRHVHTVDSAPHCPSLATQRRGDAGERARFSRLFFRASYGRRYDAPAEASAAHTAQRAALWRVTRLVARGVEVELLGADEAHDNVEDTELASGERADHDATREEALRAQLDEACLSGDVAEALHH